MTLFVVHAPLPSDIAWNACFFHEQTPRVFGFEDSTET
jgi:hypothetical protein